MASTRPNAVSDRLHQALRSGRLVSIHLNPDDPDACSVGYVDAVSDTHVRLRSVTPRGHQVGYEIRPVEDIFKVEEDDPYMRRMAALVEGGGIDFEVVERPRGGSDLVRGAVETAKNSRRYVTLRLPTWEDDVTGLVVATTDLRVSRPVDRFGEASAVLGVPWRDIESVDYGTEEEQITRLLATSDSEA